MKGDNAYFSCVFLFYQGYDKDGDFTYENLNIWVTCV